MYSRWKSCCELLNMSEIIFPSFDLAIYGRAGRWEITSSCQMKPSPPGRWWRTQVICSITYACYTYSTNGSFTDFHKTQFTPLQSPPLTWTTFFSQARFINSCCLLSTRSRPFASKSTKCYLADFNLP